MTRASALAGARVHAVGVVSGWGDGIAALPHDAKTAAAGRAIIPLARPTRSGERFRRATRECVLGVAAVDALLEGARMPREQIRGERTALIYCTAAAYGASNRGFIEKPAGALHFPYTAPSAVPAEVAIEFGLTGSYVILIGGSTATIDGLWQAAMLVARGAADHAIVLAVETFTECAELFERHQRLLGAPLVEAAAAALIVPGPDLPRYGMDSDDAMNPETVATRAGETLACAPLLALALALEAGRVPSVTGQWRGRRAALAWERA